MSKITIMKKQFLTYFLFFSTCFILFAQDGIEPSFTAINDLKNGFLLLKLPTKTRELNAYEAQIQRFSSDIEHVARIENFRYSTIAQVRTLQNDLIAGFKNDYNFSEVVITYDTSKTIFYDKNMLVKEDFSLEGKKYLILSNRKVMHEAENILKDAFVLTDKDGDVLEPPFPSEIPIRFKNLRLLQYSKKQFPRVSKQEKEVHKEIFYWRDLDKNATKALVKMLNLRMVAFENLVKSAQ